MILTTSDAEADIVTSYQLHANCYLTKPVQLDAFENLVKSINDFWLTTVKLPQHAARQLSMKSIKNVLLVEDNPETPGCCARCSASRAPTTRD